MKFMELVRSCHAFTSMSSQLPVKKKGFVLFFAHESGLGHMFQK